jgi:hypothetical protein
MSNRALPKDAEPCLTLIGRQKITSPPCALEASEPNSLDIVPGIEVAEATSDEKETEGMMGVTITSNEETSLIEKCTGDEQEHLIQLPLTSTVYVDPACKLTVPRMKNIKEVSPFVDTMMFPSVRIPVVTAKDLVKKEIGELKRHFQDHGYLYTLSMTGLLIVLVFIWGTKYGISLCCKGLRNRLTRDITNSNRWSRHIIEEGRQQLEQEKVVMLVPTAPTSHPPTRPTVYPTLNMDQLRTL